jgi:hypothetical protein
MPPEPTFDKSGYPTPATLRTIKKWPIAHFSDCNDLMEYCKKAWKYGDSYFTRAKRRSPEYYQAKATTYRWTVHTFGWSGNEDVISAMRDNWMFWTLCWVKEERGGHYVFRTV